MKRAKWLILAVLLLLAPLTVEAQTVRLYMVPSEVYAPGGGTTYYGPLYFEWRFSSGDLPRLDQVHYGFVDGYIVLADLTPEQHAWLIEQPGAWAFPESLDTNIAQVDMEALRTRFEGFHIPADWMTASNTYREFLHGTCGIFQFAKRYTLTAGETGYSRQYLFDSVTLDTQYKDFPTDVQDWFGATVASYGIDPAFIKNNSTIRQMLKTVGDYLAEPLQIGGQTF